MLNKTRKEIWGKYLRKQIICLCLLFKIAFLKHCISDLNLYKFPNQNPHNSFKKSDYIPIRSQKFFTLY